MMLLTDGLFPSKYAKWRIEGIKAFVDEGDCDILVPKVDKFVGIDYGVDYEEMKEYYNLEDYNILIFDPKYNYLNKYNKKVDGTQFNNSVKNYSYLFTKLESFNLKNYERFFHIFLSNYKLFEKTFGVDRPSKHCVHLYPNGGYTHHSHLDDVDRSVKMISTQPFITKDLIKKGFEHYIEVIGSTILPKDYEPIEKKLNTGTFKVCFSSMGDVESKGYNFYLNLIKAYSKIGASKPIEWHFVGNSTQIRTKESNIKYHPPKSQADLDKFYREEIDVIINPENGKVINGFPLGIEAAINGVVLFTTDTYNCNNYFKYSNKMIHLIHKENYMNSALKLLNLNKSRIMLHEMSKAIQKHSVSLFNYEIQQKRIVEFSKLTENVDWNRETAKKKYLAICPDIPCINHVFELSTNNRTRNFFVIENDFRSIILNSIKERKPISMARYNDGEWYSIIKNSNKTPFRTHLLPIVGKEGETFVDNHIIPIIKKKPSYYIGTSTQCFNDTLLFNAITPYLRDLKLVDGGLFAKWSIDNKLEDFFYTLRGRHVIIVGPEYLKGMKHYIEDIAIVDTINTKASWLEYDKIYTNLLNAIMESPESTPIILYCASFVAKALIDKIYDDFNDIIQLDVGAAFEPFCGRKSRPWHEALIKNIQEETYDSNSSI